jgi:hypothetical protein
VVLQIETVRAILSAARLTTPLTEMAFAGRAMSSLSDQTIFPAFTS